MADTYLQLVQELSRLTERARAASGSADWDGLTACLEQRQAIMNALDQLKGDTLAESERRTALQVLEQVMAVDADLSRMLEESLSQYREQLQAADIARTSISAYQRSARPSPDQVQARFVDKQR